MHSMRYCSPSQWESYADEHILYIRALDQITPSIFETVRIKDNPDDCDIVWFRHEVIFLDDFLRPESEQALNKILNGFGYKDLDAFVVEHADSNEFLYDKDGKLDRISSPAYIIDRWLLASLLAESRGDDGNSSTELTLSRDDAYALLKEVTGIDLNSLQAVSEDSGKADVPSGYQACYNACIDALCESPHWYEPFAEYFDVDKLDNIRDTYGADLYKECHSAVQAAAVRLGNVIVHLSACGVDCKPVFARDGSHNDYVAVYALGNLTEERIGRICKRNDVSYILQTSDACHGSAVVRCAECRDCTHCELPLGSDEYICAAKAWDDIDPAYPAFHADCGRFAPDLQPVAAGEMVLEVIQRVDDTELPVGYVVVNVNAGTSQKDIISEARKNGKLKCKGMCESASLYTREFRY